MYGYEQTILPDQQEIHWLLLTREKSLPLNTEEELGCLRYAVIGTTHFEDADHAAQS